MDDLGENYFTFQIEEMYYPHQKNNENFYNENNKSDEQKIISTGENHNSNNLKSEKNEQNINPLLLNSQNNIYSNIEDMINIEKNSDNKINFNDGFYTSDIFQNKIEQPNLNRDTSNSQYNTINGKQVITTNEIITNKFNEFYQNPEIDIEKLKNMQYLKGKNKRRTNKQIELDKKNSKEVKLNKKRGRIKKKDKLKDSLKINHSKESDDNIIKKINTHYVEEIRKWLNKSFLDDQHKNFQTEKFREKNKKECFTKLSPKLISTKIKKKQILSILDTKFKDILYTNDISPKYKKYNPDNNKILIDKIYADGTQSFIIFILEMTFSEGLNYFNGQIPDSTIVSYFKNNYNYSDKLIYEFIGNFNKIGKFLEKLHKAGNENGEDTKDYLARVNVLCLNYRNSFEKKYNRSENKKNKNKENGKESNNFDENNINSN